jgi:hypothetical protein
MIYLWNTNHAKAIKEKTGEEELELLRIKNK